MRPIGALVQSSLSGCLLTVRRLTIRGLRNLLSLNGCLLTVGRLVLGGGERISRSRVRSGVGRLLGSLLLGSEALSVARLVSGLAHGRTSNNLKETRENEQDRLMFRDREDT